MFEVAARLLNFRAAGEELNVTQGAVAQQIRRLEDGLGVQLFVRQARGLVLTKIGATYYESVRRGLLIIDRATTQLHAEADTVRVSVTPSVASKWLVPKLRELNEDHPEITVEVDSSVALTNFREDGIDLAIRQGAAPTDPELEASLLLPVTEIAVCSPGYAAKHPLPECIEDFAGHDLIQDGHKLWQMQFERSESALPSGTLSFNLADLALRAAEDGHGVALVPTLLSHLDIKAGRLVEIWRPDLDTNTGFYLVEIRTGTPRPVVQAFKDWCLTQASEVDV